MRAYGASDPSMAFAWRLCMAMHAPLTCAPPRPALARPSRRAQALLALLKDGPRLAAEREAHAKKRGAYQGFSSYDMQAQGGTTAGQHGAGDAGGWHAAPQVRRPRSQRGRACVTQRCGAHSRQRSRAGLLPAGQCWLPHIERGCASLLACMWDSDMLRLLPRLPGPCRTAATWPRRSGSPAAPTTASATRPLPRCATRGRQRA